MSYFIMAQYSDDWELDYDDICVFIRHIKKEVKLTEELRKAGMQDQALQILEVLHLLIMKVIDMPIKCSDNPDNESSTALACLYLIFCREVLFGDIFSYTTKTDMKLMNANEERRMPMENCEEPLVIYFCDSALLYFIKEGGYCSLNQGVDVVAIITESNVTKMEMVKMQSYLVIGNFIIDLQAIDVVYNPNLRMFTLLNIIHGHKVGFRLPHGELNAFSNCLCEIRSNRTLSKKLRRNGSNNVADVSDSLLKGSKAVSDFASTAGSKTAELISWVTPKLIKNMESVPVEVPNEVVKGMEVTNTVCKITANVTGYFATKVIEGLGVVSECAAPHVAKTGISLLIACGMEEIQAKELVSDSAQITGAAVEGFMTVTDGVYKCVSDVAGSFGSNIVKVVEHRYGEPMSKVTRNIFDSIGNVMATSSNIKLLTPKGIIKKTAKGVAASTVLQHVQASESSTSGLNNYPKKYFKRDKVSI